MEVKKITKSSGNCEKLVPHFYPHKKYCIHYRNLNFVVKELGVKVDELHNVVSFKQSQRMKPYIEGNNELRTQAKNDFEKDFSKLMNNAVFGKTMENVRNRMNLHLTTDHQNAIKWFSRVDFTRNTNANGLYLIERIGVTLYMMSQCMWGVLC